MKPGKTGEQVPIIRLSDQTGRVPGFSIAVGAPPACPRLPTHKHEHFEIVYSASEGCNHPIQGKKIKVRPGTLFFISPYLVHNEDFASDAKAYVIQFTSRFLNPLSVSLPLNINHLALHQHPEYAPFLLQQSMLFELQSEQRAAVEERLRIIAREYEANKIGSDEIIRCQLKLLFLQIVRLNEGAVDQLIQEKRHSDSKCETTLRLLNYLSAKLSEKISLEDLSNEVCLSPNYISHLLKRETGKSFTELVMELRLERAKELLQFTRFRLTDIAEQVGFSDASYFSKRFRTYVGQSPRKFRKSFT